MASDNHLEDKRLSEEQLEEVTGGTTIETIADWDELYKRGLLPEVQAFCSATVRDMLHQMGYAGYIDKGGVRNNNVYTDKQGNPISREDFWSNFDSENGTKIIRW